MIEKIEHDGSMLALIVRREFREPGITFFTSDELSQQLAYMRHPAGKQISPHVHKEVTRQVFNTQEALFIKSGKVRVDFYTVDQNYVGSRILRGGDVILLVSGGHGFEILEEAEMIEVKQGPYVGTDDKVRFDGVAADDVVVSHGHDL